ncbi:hypothetical protein [uncultured Roseobacter sp.]|uniref:hypothetical protein n=1 Tax=uncultured Roseobacter sp. TaxID=114847 RepID=UPI0026181DB3|nr:hypothetical protein [uncultured Roseobacter sp.]
MIHNTDKNLTRTLAILSTHPDEIDIGFQAREMLVAGHKLCIQNEDDREVLSILMASKEFGFAVTAIEQMAKKLREMQARYEGLAQVVAKEMAA